MSVFIEEQVITESGTQDLSEIGLAGQWSDAVLQLDVTDAGGAAGDLFDLFIQGSADEGVTWDDFIHFTQSTGADADSTYIAVWSGLVEPEDELHTPTDATMLAGVRQGPQPNTWRAKWVVVNDTAPTFTIKLVANVTVR